MELQAGCWQHAAWTKERDRGLCAFGPQVQGRVQPFSLTVPLLRGNPKWVPGTAQVRPEVVEAGRGAAVQEGQEIRGAQGTRAEELFTSTKHILGSACGKDVRAGARIQHAFVLCVSEIIPRRSMGFHIFPHLFLICSLDRCQTTIPRMEKHKTKYKALYLLWFYSETFTRAWLCSCPRRVWRPREEPARGTDLLSAGFSQQGPENGWAGHRLYLKEQLCVYVNPMAQVGHYLLLASLGC